MSRDKQALVVDSVGGALSAVMEELDELGFRVVWVPSLEAALAFIEANPELCLMVGSATATSPDGSAFWAHVRKRSPDLRIIWGVLAGSPASRAGPEQECGPDSLIPEPFQLEELRRAIAELLSEHFYPAIVVEAVESAALEVLSGLGSFVLKDGAFLAGNQSALADVSAVIPFSGGAAGHLLMGVTTEHAGRLCEALLPGPPPFRLDRMEDLVGELCNQILGRINSFFAQRAVSIQQGTPIFIRAPGSTFRYPGRQPSFGATFAKSDIRVSLEYYLSEFSPSTLQAPAVNRVLQLGEVRYF